MTKSIQEVALDRAVTLLKAAGCEYKIRTPTGTLIGKLELVAPAPPPKARKRRDLNAELHHLDLLRPLAPGDVVVIPVPKSIEHARAQAVIASTACLKFGKGNYITRRVKGERGQCSVEVLRVQ